MNNFLELKEFDSIICEDSESNNPDHYRVPKNIFDLLASFIREFDGKQGYSDSDSLDFFSIGYKRGVGDVITVKNYVGLIELKNGYRIQILPKIEFYHGEDRTKKVFINMLKSLDNFSCKSIGSSSLSLERMNIYEIFINMYLLDVINLTKHGVRSSYIEEENNLNYIRGKLEISNHLKYNLSHKEKFYVNYDEYSINRSENRIIKSTLLKLRRIANDQENIKYIKQLLPYFDSVQESSNYESDFNKVKIDRSTKEYDSLMKWSKVFLFNKSFTTFSGSNEARALLFPMETVYERYIAKEIKKEFTPIGWDVSIQDKGFYLFDNPKRFSLMPDIVMRKAGITVVLDTKWKKLFNNERFDYGIKQSDMYQMYAYSKKYNTPYVCLLYPLSNEMNDYKKLSFSSNDNTCVTAFFIDLMHRDDMFKSLNRYVSSINNI